MPSHFLYSFCKLLSCFTHYISLNSFIHSGGILTFILGTFTMSHVWLIIKNRTTIENNIFQKWKAGKSQDRCITMFTETGKNVFHQGKKNNWLEVMGDQKLLWFCKFLNSIILKEKKVANSEFLLISHSTIQLKARVRWCSFWI